MTVVSRLVRRAVAVMALLPFAACGGDTTDPSPTPTPAARPRSFALGFTDFPHARTVEAIDAALDVIRRAADLILAHFDDGVPWEEAANGAPYPAG